MIFDPVAVNKQLDSMLTTVPPGKRGVLVASGNLVSKQLSAALVFKISDNVGAYARVTKTLGGKTEADAGAKISFLIDQGSDRFTYNELVAVFRGRGHGWFRSHINAYKILSGKEVRL